ncbi:MAG: chromate efflux transporter [Pseudomonadota bacterium]
MSDTSVNEAGSSGGSANHSTPSLGEAFKVWLRIGLLSFGGPAAQIALMHREVVDQRGWMSEQSFLNALSFCMLLPGPEAMQVATYAGWRMHGTIGGLIAGALFVVPGAIVIAFLATIYVLAGTIGWVDALFLGVKSAVIVIVLEALLRVAKRALLAHWHWGVAGLAFVAIFFLSLPFPVIILAAGVFGAMRAVARAENEPVAAAMTTSVGATVGRVCVWLVIWWLPVAGLYASNAQLLFEVGVFFSKLAVVTFGGAYAVLAYLAQDVVEYHGWLSAGQMLDGLGLAETTPGPLILVTEFVGFLAGYQSGGLPLAFAAAGVTLWVTFVPCFLWIFAGAPYLDWIASRPRLSGALAGITAAVVGVMLNLSVWFALQVFFGEVTTSSVGPLTLWLPDLSTLDWRVVSLAVVAGVLLLRLHWNVASVIGVVAVLGVVSEAIA